MGFYGDFIKANGSGQHTFDGVVLDQLASYQTNDKRATADGEVIQIKAGATVIVDDVLLHRNGRVGGKDSTKDILVLPVEKLSVMPEDLQALFFQYERVPTGYRKDEIKK